MLDDTTWFWTIVDANGLANVSSDEIVALREIIARAETAEARVTALEAEKAGLVKALERIGRWFDEFPDTGRTWPDGSPMSYAACFGSNGERDFMRSVAAQALSRSSTEVKNDGA